MRARDKRTRRICNGAAILESAIVLPILLIGMMSILDLSILAIRQNALTTATIDIARRVSLGEFYDSREGTPKSIQCQLSDVSAMGSRIHSAPPMMNLEKIQLRIDWLDGGDSGGSQAVISSEYIHSSLLKSLVPWNDARLSVSTQITLLY